MVGLTTLNILRISRAILMSFCIVNTPRCQMLIWGCHVFWLFQQTFACEKVIPKNGLYCEIKSSPHPQTPFSPLPPLITHTPEVCNEHFTRKFDEIINEIQHYLHLRFEGFEEEPLNCMVKLFDFEIWLALLTGSDELRKFGFKKVKKV